MTETFLDALTARLLEAGRYSTNSEVAPAAILWPDAQREWEPLIASLRARLPVLVLGEYEPESRTGPSYWIRCMVDRTLDDRIPEDETPIVYLPGVSKQDLRAMEEADQLLKPLAELQYRGTLFTQKNGRDWTIAAFIQSNDGGLGIAVAADNGTKEAMLGARRVLASLPVEEMRRATPLRADFFNERLQPDLPRRVLEWLSDPEGYRARTPEEEWQAFCAQCRSRYGSDPSAAGPVSMARELGEGLSEAWERVWERFEEAPEQYPGVPGRLRAAYPKPAKKAGRELWQKAGRWPQENDDAEQVLREALGEPGGQSEVRSRIVELEQQHAERRAWVWVRLGQAPLAQAVEHLADLARWTSRAITGTTVPELAAEYADFGWQADDAVLRALAAVDRAPDTAAVREAVRAVYQPWLEECARRFQDAAAVADFAAAYPEQPMSEWPAGTCIVFCDGLRLDLAHRLDAALASQGAATELSTRLTALPSITGTAKPAVSPVAGALGTAAGLDPAVLATGSVVDVSVLRGQLESHGYQVLQGDELGEPSGRAWTEAGNVDELGHKQSPKLPALAAGEIGGLAERVTSLLDAGWTQVVVVTDHGWLYLPGGLPKAELDVGLVGKNLRKGRCARLKPGADSPYRTVPWHWDADVRIAIAPGICCFQQGKVYEHGGLSPQECVTPVLTVRRTSVSGGSAVPSLRVSWRNLRCVFDTVNAPKGSTVDLRMQAGAGSTSVIDGPRALRDDGTVGVAVEDDSKEHEKAFAVLLGPDGEILAQTETTIGGDD